MHKFNNCNIKASSSRKHKPKSSNSKNSPKNHLNYDDFVISQFKNDKEFLKTCLKQSFNDYIKTGNKAYFIEALEKAVKAHGTTKIANATKLNRQNIYSLISKKHNPTLKSFKVLMGYFDLEIALK